jgi:hypothetical protein
MSLSVLLSKYYDMDPGVANASAEDVEDLKGIYSSPHLYHNQEEASWFVKSFFDARAIMAERFQRTLRL